MPLWPRPTDSVIMDGDQSKQPTVASPALAGTLLTLRLHHLHRRFVISIYCIIVTKSNQNTILQ